MDFNTMQQMFATNMQNVMTPNQQFQQPQQPQQYQQPQSNNLNFNELPENNNNLNFSQVPQTNNNFNNNISNVNLTDFNTMQNLFQTQQNPLNIEPKKENSKSEDLFKMLEEQSKASEGVSMSTFSGGKQGGFENLDLGNFGTVQMSKPNNEPFDPQGFSFSKKENTEKKN